MEASGGSVSLWGRRRTVHIVVAVAGIFFALAGTGCSGSEQSEQTTTIESTGDPDIDAARKLVNNECVRDWYDSGGYGSLSEACPDWDK